MPGEEGAGGLVLVGLDEEEAVERDRLPRDLAPIDGLEQALRPRRAAGEEGLRGLAEVAVECRVEREDAVRNVVAGIAAQGIEGRQA